MKSIARLNNKVMENKIKLGVDKLVRKRKRPVGSVPKSSKHSARMEAEPLHVDTPRVETPVDDTAASSSGDTTPTETRFFNELYVGNRYAADSKGGQHYARKYTGEEYYLTEDNGQTRYAVRSTSEGALEPFLARDEYGQPVYVFGSDGTPVFPILKGQVVYAADSEGNQVYPIHPETGQQFYMNNEDGDQVCAQTNDGLMFYAQQTVDDQRTEVLPRDRDGQPVYIVENGQKMLPFNFTKQRPIYPVDAKGNETYLKDEEGNEYYAMHPMNVEQFYAMDAKKNERLAHDKDGKPFYRRNNFGDEMYPIDRHGDETYSEVNTVEVYARNMDGGGKYAKLAKGGEYYPKQYIFPRS